MRLPPHERAEVAAQLIASLDDASNDASDEAVAEAWKAEVTRRMFEVESGTAKLVPAGQAVAQVRATIRRVRER